MRINMKQSVHVLFATAAIAFLVLLCVREQPRPVAPAPESGLVSALPIPPAAAAGPPVNQSLAPNPAPAEAKAIATPPPGPELPPIPRTTKELNQLADSALPLSTRMAVLAKLMMEAPPEQAKAAAIRSVFIVRNVDYTSQLQPLLVAGEVKPEALEVLSLNLYDRPLEMQLPALAAIRDRAGHPLREMATDALVFHLKDKGNASGEALARGVKDYLSPPPP